MIFPQFFVTLCISQSFSLKDCTLYSKYPYINAYTHADRHTHVCVILFQPLPNCKWPCLSYSHDHFNHQQNYWGTFEGHFDSFLSLSKEVAVLWPCHALHSSPTITVLRSLRSSTYVMKHQQWRSLVTNWKNKWWRHDSWTATDHETRRPHSLSWRWCEGGGRGWNNRHNKSVTGERNRGINCLICHCILCWLLWIYHLFIYLQLV